jgi:hypothetical protein
MTEQDRLPDVCAHGHEIYWVGREANMLTGLCECHLQSIVVWLFDEPTATLRPASAVTRLFALAERQQTELAITRKRLDRAAKERDSFREKWQSGQAFLRDFADEVEPILERMKREQQRRAQELGNFDAIEAGDGHAE